EKGVCDYCYEYDRLVQKRIFTGHDGEQRLQKLVSDIKEKGKNKEYDCIIGVSGGVDSSFVAYKTKELGLRPLAVHLDNGWNSELAVKNIEEILNKLNIELYTYVIDWEEFKSLQLSFLKASVVDIEVLTDHAIMAAMFKAAKKNGIKYIIGGDNFVTESPMPKTWIYAKWDIRNIKGINKKFGNRNIVTFPTYGLFDIILTQYILKYRYVEILNYIDYNKQEAIKVLQDQLNWRYYGGKHYESIFTKFYQAYILPTKFGIDKRKAHFSSLIRSGQISREEALEEIKMPLYDPGVLREETEYVLKKFGLSEVEFENIMRLPVRSHLDYPNSLEIFNFLLRLKRIFD
ncbi:MAG: N-acetyl sugar amidotransferase, partial [Deltaproteobacteria bacterium]